MINSWTEKGRIMASYRVREELEVRDLAPAEYAAFVRDPKPWSTDMRVTEIRPDFPGWHKLLFLDYDSRKEALEAHSGVLFEGDVSPARRFLTDHNCRIEAPRRAYLDIETDSRVPFASAILGGATILSWALVGEEGYKFTHILEDWHEQAEAELLALLWEIMGRYDQIAAWNGSRFDFEVIKARSEDLAKRYSRTMQPYWEHRRRLLFVDQMLCFKRHHMAAESGDEKTSMALNSVCQAILKEGKHDFDSSKTYEAWAAGGARRQELLSYNYQDTALLPKLEAETGYLALQQTIGEVTLTPINSHTLKPMPWIDAYLLKLARRRETHLPSKKPGGGEGESVEGAIVIPPSKLGIHEGVHVCDFKSLYPTVIRTWNLGSDTKGPGPCRSANDITFAVTEESMLAATCREFMNLRDHWKKEMKKFPPGTPEWKDAERKSKAYKIANNSCYGVTGNPYFRLYDPEITAAVTGGARLLLLATMEAASSRGMTNIYGDTDSCFIQGGTEEEFKAFVSHCNAEVYPKVLDAHGCRQDFRCIELAYEKMFARIIFPLGSDDTPSAKRYAGLYRHYGGTKATADSKPEIRGLEYMRTDGTRLARRLQREVIEMLLRGNPTADELHAWVQRQRGLFFDRAIELEDIVMSKGISRPLDEYKVEGPHVRLAKALAEAGEDVGEGTRISFVVTDAQVSPQQVIDADDFDGVTCDRHFYWNQSVYPPVMRVLAGALPTSNWQRWIAKRPRPVLPGQLTFDNL